MFFLLLATIIVASVFDWTVEKLTDDEEIGREAGNGCGIFLLIAIGIALVVRVILKN